jgi:hypothetical protein
MDIMRNGTTRRAQPKPAGSFTQISAGYNFACCVRKGGRAACLGDNSRRQAKPPRGNFRLVRAALNFACGSTTRRRLVCWGKGISGSPPPAGRFSQDSAGGDPTVSGSDYACVVKVSGSVLCWGPEGSVVIPALTL